MQTPEHPAARSQNPTVRALLNLFRDTVRFFWRYPDRMLAAVFQHYFGEPEKAKRIIEEMREADRDR